MREFFSKVFKVIARFKYLIIIIVGVLVVGFLDNNSCYHRYQNQQKIKELGKSIKRYRLMHKRDSARLKELETHPEAIRKLARERYYMKEDDEDIFILSDDDKDAIEEE
ncbi:MAG: septum formation initiator family protein [Bacteroidaceae bacterium]|nr:septum formation initiator family protein [Bacteroidaceae bacterium]